jgi:hypothetical protein
MKSQTHDSKIDLSQFKEMSKEFQSIAFNYQNIYKEKIEPMAQSEYMFNYFHWTTDIKSMKIIDCFGIQKILGYDESTFTLEKSVKIIHPSFAPFVMQYAYIAYTMLSLPQYRPLSSKADYCIQFPILDANGKYVLVQKNISIIVTDNMGNPIVNYNRFEVLGEYFGLPIPIKPRVFFRTHLDFSQRAKEAELELNEKIKHTFIKIVGITPKQLQILKMLADKTIIDGILKQLNYSLETHKTHTKKILLKARKTISPLFRDAREVAFYLRSMSIV